MRSLLLRRSLAICVVVASILPAANPSNAVAQGQSTTVTVFADASGSQCTLSEGNNSDFSVYIIHKIPPGWGYVGSRFRLLASPGNKATYIGETIHLPYYFGDTQSGIEVEYAYCVSGSLLLATVVYHANDTSSPCSYFEVVPHPHPQNFSGGIDVMDCFFDTSSAATMGRLYVNPVEGECAPWCTVAVEPSTWGQVKALYRN